MTWIGGPGSRRRRHARTDVAEVAGRSAAVEVGRTRPETTSAFAGTVWTMASCEQQHFASGWQGGDSWDGLPWRSAPQQPAFAGACSARWENAIHAPGGTARRRAAAQARTRAKACILTFYAQTPVCVCRPGHFWSIGITASQINGDSWGAESSLGRQYNAELAFLA